MTKNSTIPTPIEMDELEELLIEFGILDDDTKHAAPEITASASK
jgi:nitrogenase iron protein NifH